MINDWAPPLSPLALLAAAARPAAVPLQVDASSVYDILDHVPAKDSDDDVPLVGCCAHCAGASST